MLLGIAIRTGSPLSLNLAEPVWKQLAGMNLTIADLSEVRKQALLLGPSSARHCVLMITGFAIITCIYGQKLEFTHKPDCRQWSAQKSVGPLCGGRCV